MALIGVLSDTHIRQGGKRQIPPRVFEILRDVDLILHAGDLNTLQVINDLEAVAPVFAVHGNNDDGEAMRSLPTTRRIEIENSVIGLVHGDQSHDEYVRPLEDAPGNRQTAANALSYFEFEDDVNCVVFGHSHRPLLARRVVNGRSVLLFNPGSPTDKRYGPHYACGLLRVNGQRLRPELITW